VRGLQDRIALVTGATGILGRSIATRLAAEGATVVASSRDRSKAERMLEQEKLKHSVAAQLDLSQAASITELVRRLSTAPGLPTIVVANATCRDGGFPSFHDITHESFFDLFKCDVAGHFLLVREILEALSGKPASVVFLSSVYALVGVDHRIYPAELLATVPQYASAKAGAIAMARWLAAFFGSTGTRVNVVAAGGIASDRNSNEQFLERYSAKTMLGRMASADEIASAVAFLASDEASYITGECLVVDGGLSAW
jgi:NAD(P)-dependent dehydrogenase (short-subunit alcohol dehydrogenase family)